MSLPLGESQNSLRNSEAETTYWPTLLKRAFLLHRQKPNLIVSSMGFSSSGFSLLEAATVYSCSGLLKVGKIGVDDNIAVGWVEPDPIPKVVRTNL